MQITRVSPIEISAEPVAVRMKPGSIVAGRSSRGVATVAAACPPWRPPSRAIIPERYGRGIVRALVVSNMRPDRDHPERGSFVRDQVAALRALEDVEVELYEFPPGPRALVAAAARAAPRATGAAAPASTSCTRTSA